MRHALITLTLAATLAVAGCASLKPVAEVGAAAAVVPGCRALLVDYLGDDVGTVAPELAALDALYADVGLAVRGDAGISLLDAIDRVAAGPATLDAVEARWEVIRGTVERRGGFTPAPLVSCADILERGWSAMREQPAATAARDWLRVWGPFLGPLARSLVVKA